MIRRPVPAAAAWLALGIAAAIPAPAADPADGPPMRIRLSSDTEVATLSAPGGLRILDRDSLAPLGPDPFGTRATFVVESSGAPREPVFRAQVASLSDEAEARALASRLSRELNAPGVVHYHPDRRAWRVRLGEGKTAEALDPLVRSLAQLGYGEVWVTEDYPEGDPGAIRVVDARWNDYPARRPTLRVVPARGSDWIRLEDRDYRGVIDVQIDRRGRLAVINELPMEWYLRGVVPNELGPLVYPQLEALKAQAVAARTYAWRNRGQFGEDGYDLCDTPRCQVYFGAGTEHELSDRAIQDTAGLVATQDGEPIHALYSSTCGGHTEDGFQVFPEETGPYLRGVPCYPEQAADARRTWTVSGRPPGPPLLDEGGGALGRAAELLSGLGIMDTSGWHAGEGERRATPREIEAWLGALLRHLGKTPAEEGPPVETRDDLVAALVHGLGWDLRAEMRVAEADLGYLLDYPDRSSIPQATRRAWALLLKDRIVVPDPTGHLRPEARPSRSQMVRILAALLDHYDAEGLYRATLLQAQGGRLRVSINKVGPVELALAPDARLLRVSHGTAQPVAELLALTGDKINYRTGGGGNTSGTVDYLEVEVSDRSASDDRFTTVYEWEERVSRDELAKRLRDSVRGIGQLRDVIPVERGVSGRVTKLRVVGTHGAQTIRGFPIRTALGIRETLFTVDRRKDADGNVVEFLFSGKGWGHGVGMCQVGAYGMALRGLTFRDILHHYYTDIDLTRVY